MPEQRPRRTSYRKLAELSVLGLSLPSSIVVGMVMGWVLDRLLKTPPWMLGIFTVLGVAAGLLSLIRGLKKLGIEKDENENGEGSPEPADERGKRLFHKHGR